MRNLVREGMLSIFHNDSIRRILHTSFYSIVPVAAFIRDELRWRNLFKLTQSSPFFMTLWGGEGHSNMFYLALLRLVRLIG